MCEEITPPISFCSSGLWGRVRPCRRLRFVVFAGEGPDAGAQRVGALRCEGSLGSLGDRLRRAYCATRTRLNRPPNSLLATVDRCAATVDTAVHSWHGGKVSELNATAAALLG